MIKRFLFTALLLLTCAVSASAYYFMVDGLCYNINSDYKSVTVTFEHPKGGPSYDSLSGAINIPASVEYNRTTYPVTSIGNEAFRYCTGLTSVTIPNSVTEIGKEAFNGCTGLMSVTIGNSVTSISSSAFSGCSGLTSVTWNAKNYSDFSSSSYAPFKDLTNIKTFKFGSEVKKIPAYLCYGLTGLTSVTIPNSVTEIGKEAFNGCTGLTSVTIGNSVTSIGTSAFYGCSGLTSVTWNAKNYSDFSSSSYAPFKGLTNIKTFEFGNEVEKIPAYLCSGLTGLTSVTIGNSVTSIGSSAFEGCSGLTSVNCKANTPPTVDSSTFGGTTQQSNIGLYIPTSSFPAYSSNSIWGKFLIYHQESGITQGSGGFSGSGTGTEDDPYLIFNPIQLHNVRNFTGREGVVFKLMADIDLTQFLSDNNPSQGWEPIGVQESPFKGVFHGEGHTIKGLYINRPLTDNIGLFGFAEYATFDKVNIESRDITGANYSGSFCGYAINSTITGITTHSTIEGKALTGGFAGYLRNCTANDIHHVGNVNSTDGFVGGLVGYLTNSDLNICSYSGTVTGAEKIGGIAGVVFNSSLQSVTNTAIVNGETHTGGVFGISGECTATDVNSNASVSGNIYVGGFAGQSGDGCIATDVNSNASVSGHTYVGGFAGYAKQLNATRCYANGNVTAQTDDSCPYAGGFVGYVNYEGNDDILVTINECGYIGDINAGADSGNTSSVGGLIGYVAKANTIEISNSFAIGDFTADGIAGGLLGYIGPIGNATVLVSNSYYSGWLTGKENVGGIVGYGDHVTLDKNYASGYATGSRYVGGIAGSLVSGSTVTACVAAQDGINAVNGDAGRVYGTTDGTCTMGTQGTNAANRGMTTMNVVSQGLQLTVEDGAQHGTSLGKGLLKYKSSYQGLNWNFQDDWTILETESYPYKPLQCAPPVITSTPVSGNTSLSGQCAVGAKVYVRIGQDEYEAQVAGTNWTASVPALQSGVTVKVYTVAEGLIHSYYVNTTVAFPGEGSEQSPYLIYTANDLANINNYSYYKVMNDIDLTDWIAEHNPTGGWMPVGSNGGSTMKQLDGNGHTITGLWLNSSTNNAGLIFNMVNATIKNLHVVTAEGKTVNSSANNVGILVGNSVGCTFENVTVSGKVAGKNYVGGITGCDSNSRFTSLTVSNATISGNSRVGGIAGEVTSASEDGIVADIAYCQADVTLSGSDYIGGIVGYSTASIKECASHGSVTATDLVNCRAGGIVGHTTGFITDCYSTTDTRGGLYAGGIAGYSFGKIGNCYASGDLYATKFGGGIVGYLDGPKAEVNNCFAISNKIDVSDQQGVAMRVIGGFKNDAKTPQSNNYALKTMVVSVNDVTQIIYDDPLEGISINDVSLKQQATYSNQGWDFDNTWGIEENESHPFLQEFAVPEYTLGDVNNDSKINVNDYVITASYILEQDPQPFNFAAADIDENGKVNVNDLVGVAALALTFEGAPRMMAPHALYAPSVTMIASLNGTGNKRVISVALDNNIGLTALQMDITLPVGITLCDAALSERGSASHTVATAQLDNGSYRLLAASSAIKAFKGNEGVLLTLTIEGNAEGVITLSDIQLATPDARGLEHDDIVLNLGVTGINDINANDNNTTHIYASGNNIIVEAMQPTTVIIALPNGISVSHKVQAGRNVFDAPSAGVVIVSAGDKHAKLLF